MIEKIEISGSNYKIEDSFHKYAVKRIGKLDKYLPHGSKINEGKGSKSHRRVKR